MKRQITIAGLDSNTDLLMGTILATMESSPFFYSERDSLPKEANKLIAKNEIEKVFLVKSGDFLSPDIEKHLIEKGIEVEWIQGKDCYDLSIILAERFFPEASEFIMINPEFVEDSVTAPTLSINKKAPILFTDKDSVPKVIEEYLKSKCIAKFHFFGGEDVISDDVANRLHEIASPSL